MNGNGSGVPELFASRIETCEDNSDGTFRLWFVVDRRAFGPGGEQTTISEPVASIVVPLVGLRFSIGIVVACLNGNGAGVRAVTRSVKDNSTP